MKINKPGLWISAIYLLIHLIVMLIPSGSGMISLGYLGNLLLVMHNFYLLEFLGVIHNENSWVFWLAIATAFQIYIVSYFIGHLFRNKS